MLIEHIALYTESDEVALAGLRNLTNPEVNGVLDRCEKNAADTTNTALEHGPNLLGLAAVARVVHCAATLTEGVEQLVIRLVEQLVELRAAHYLVNLMMARGNVHRLSGLLCASRSTPLLCLSSSWLA